jgi:hypothetical protein
MSSNNQGKRCVWPFGHMKFYAQIIAVLALLRSASPKIPRVEGDA